MAEWLRDVPAQWTNWMLPTLVQATWLGLAVAAFDGVARGWRWPQLRLALWLLLFSKLVVPPSWGSPWALSPSWLGPGVPGLTDAHSIPSTTVIVGAVGDSRLGAPSGACLWFFLWLAGVSCLAGVALLRQRALARTMARWAEPAPVGVVAAAESTAAQLGLRRRPRVLVLPQLGVPAVVGVFRPVVLLPRALVAAFGESGSGLPCRSRDALSHVLLHELAHVRRGDLWVDAVCRWIQLLYWFHPLVWLAAARVRALRELCCDATVAGVLRERTADYRDTLMAYAARGLEPSRSAISGMGYFTGPATIISRLEHLREPDRAKVGRARRLGYAGIAILFGVGFVPSSVEGESATSPPRLTGTSVSGRSTVPLSFPTDDEIQLAQETIAAATRGEFRSSMRVSQATRLLGQAAAMGALESPFPNKQPVLRSESNSERNPR